MKHYDPQTIEPKWQKEWTEDKLYQADIKSAKKPYYNLVMFPYPSGEGLHIGHGYPYSGGDIRGRFKKMQGMDVFEPMGYDAFGIHSENFAIKQNTHPVELIAKTVANFRQQLESLGCMFDWSHELNSTDPSYYKWTQWIFLQLYKAGLAERKKAPVNFCPSCKTVLADEQVISGECERCGSVVERRELEQWFFKITRYAEKLLKNLDCLPAGALGPNFKITEKMAKSGIDWSENVKTLQRNWIGKSEGALIKFALVDHVSPELGRSSLSVSSNSLRSNNDGTKDDFASSSPVIAPATRFLEVFTTRPDTIFGATFLVLAPEHPLVKEITTPENKSDIEKYASETIGNRNKTTENRKKTGHFTGAYCINPLTKESIPVWVADYVSMDYGTGAIMAVPAHDQRDWDFAKKYNLPIKMVICPNYPEPKCPVLDKAYEEYGYLVGSGEFNGLPTEEAKKKIAEYLQKNQFGEATVNFHLRDWLISRQRYWGPPIPIIYCDKCGIVPVPEEDLPVELPYVENFKPLGTGKSPLAEVSEFVNTKCPKCKGPAKRETDVSDNFLDSSWYFMRYPSVDALTSGQAPFDPEVTKKWLPVDMYIGGPEHAVLHLMYTRFITMALHDLGFIEFEEPFKKFYAHGHITKGGSKMSKSKGNVVNPNEYIKAYGADTFRIYLMFMGPYNEGGDWNDKGIGGVTRFLNRVWNIIVNSKFKIQNSKVQLKSQNLDGELRIMHKTIKKVTEDIENLRYNTAIAALMEYLNFLYKEKTASNEALETMLLLLAPFAPHITEELWEVLGNKYSIHQQSWPKWEEKYIKEETVTVVVQVNAKVRAQITVSASATQEEVKRLALADPQVQKHVGGQEIKNTIYVPGRLINLVVG